MATRCEVCGQYPIQGTIRTFFPWPADISQRAYWQTCLGIQDLDLSKPELFICSDHFDQLQMIRKGSTLRKDAFPKRYEGPLPTFPQGGEVPPEPPKMEPSLETPCPDVKNEDGIFGTSGPPAPLFDDEEIMPEELSMAKLLLLFTAAAKERPSGITPLVTPVAEETKAFSNILIDRQQKYLDSYCKSCLRQAELVNMMEANCEGVPVLLMYKSVFMTELDLSEIPQLMCHTCIGLLFQCFKFTTMTLRSCEVLRAARERFKYLPPLDDSDIDLKNIPEKYSATPAPIAAVIESDEDDKQEVKKVVRKRKATMKVKLSAPPKKKGRPARRASVKSKKVNKKILDSDVSSSESENFDNDEADPDFEDAAAIKDESPESSDVEPELEEKEEPEDEGDEEKVEEDENYCMLCRHKFSNMARHMDKVHRVDWENKSCERCEKSFETLKKLFGHVSLEHKLYKCSLCQIEFDDKKDLKRHVELSGCGKQIRREAKKREKEKTPAKCVECKEQFSSQTEFFNHFTSRDHYNLTCQKCQETCETQETFLRHITLKQCKRNQKSLEDKANSERTQTKPKRKKVVQNAPKKIGRPKMNIDEYWCIKCENFSSSTFKAMFQHYLEEHQYETKCILCNITFKQRQSMLNHMYTHSKTTYCRVHFIAFENNEELKEHLKIPNHDRVCLECDSMVLKSSKEFFKHRRNMHLGKIKVKCPHCPLYYENRQNVRRHILRFHENLKFMCEQCGNTYTTRTNLRLHVARQHEGQEPEDFEPVCCEECGKMLRNQKTLHYHRFRKHWGHSCMCRHCKKTFPDRDKLEEHIKETGHTLYQCKLCPKSYVTNVKYLQHLKIHTETDEKSKHKNVGTRRKWWKYRNEGKVPTVKQESKHQLVCSICKREFKNRHTMMQHKKIHYSEKPFKCDICDKTFRIKRFLMCHVNTHTGNRPFKCQYCDKGFMNDSSKYQHEMIHTGKRPHKCPACDKGFISSSAMKKHIQIHMKDPKRVAQLSEYLKTMRPKIETFSSEQEALAASSAENNVSDTADSVNVIREEQQQPSIFNN